MLAAGVPLAVVSKRLGHSSTAITGDTCSHLLRGVGRQAAEAATALVPRAARCDPSVIPIKETGSPDADPEPSQEETGRSDAHAALAGRTRGDETGGCAARRRRPSLVP